MERWEYEIVEFKEAKSQYPTDKIGRYVSAISNEANLKNQQYGWLIFGVSESKNKHVVGSNYKDTKSLDHFKYEISKSTTDGLTFLDIFEFIRLWMDRKSVWSCLRFRRQLWEFRPHG